MKNHFLSQTRSQQNVNSKIMKIQNTKHHLSPMASSSYCHHLNWNLIRFNLLGMCWRSSSLSQNTDHLFFFFLLYSFGRRWVYYVSIVCCILGRILTIVTTDSYIWFLIYTSLASIGINSLFQAPQIIAMEISRE